MQLQSLDKALAAEMADHVKGEWKFAGFEIKMKNDIPKQGNGWDCGLLVMLYMNKPNAMQIADKEVVPLCTCHCSYSCTWRLVNTNLRLYRLSQSVSERRWLWSWSQTRGTTCETK